MAFVLTAHDLRDNTTEVLAIGATAEAAMEPATDHLRGLFDDCQNVVCLIFDESVETDNGIDYICDLYAERHPAEYRKPLVYRVSEMPVLR